MDLNLNGKTALVCGASDGIGKAAAMELSRMGARIILLARNADKLEAVKKELSTSHQQQHHYLVADFDDPIALEQVVSTFLKEKNQVNILINNTGGPPGGPAHKANLEEYVTAFRQHLLCNQLLVSLVLPGMKDSGYGRIINVISTSVKAPLPNLGVSNTIRGAVANWSKTLANELGEFGITVNNVLPGATETGRLASIISNKSAKTGKSEDEVAKAMSAAVPLRRFAKPEEVANAIAFLASPSAAYVSGINLPVDGGRTPNL